LVCKILEAAKTRRTTPDKLRETGRKALTHVALIGRGAGWTCRWRCWRSWWATRTGSLWWRTSTACGDPRHQRPEWAERTKRVAARVPGLDIFSDGLVERQNGA